MQNKHNRLSLVEILPERSADKHKVALWQCDCGRTKRIALSRVVTGHVRSCGCLVVEMSREANRTHGMRGSREYTSWQAMKRRCHDPQDKDFPRYGGRGITVCEEWQKSFETFYAYIGTRPIGTTLDRYPNKAGNYEPGNVRWATPHEQSRNRKDLTVLQTPLGQMALVDYASAIGISKGAAHLRLKRGKLEGCTRV